MARSYTQKRIKKNDTVKIISGARKGTTGKVTAVLTKKDAALIEGVGIVKRHIRPSQLNPKGSTKDVHIPVQLCKLALVADEKTAKTSRVAYKKDANGTKLRIAKQLKNKEIK